MTGADIIGALLREDAELTALVAPESIKGGLLSDSVVLPALLVRTVSGTEHQTLTLSDYEHTIERVSVAVRASTYREQKDVIALVRKCCGERTGDLAGALRVAIAKAGKGPDVNGPGGTFEQTQDFRVSWDAPI